MAAFTKLVIMRVFENLLSVKPLEKITVKDITDQCGISRNTFYYHYQDIYQVFKAYIDYSLEEIFKFLQQENEKDQDHICEKAVEFLENHRTIFENILRSAKSEEVHKILDDGSSRFFRYVIDRVGEGIDSEPEDREMICAMCQHAVGEIMHEWLSRENADKKSLSDILMRANYLFGGGFGTGFRAKRKPLPELIKCIKINDNKLTN